MVKKRSMSVIACRVCLSLEKNKVIMDTTNGWLDLFTYCFGLEIDPKDQAKALCKKCADSIKNYASLKVKCLESDEVWKSKLCGSEYLSETEDFKLNNINKLDIEHDALSIKGDSEKTNYSSEKFEKLDNDIDQNQFYHNNANNFLKCLNNRSDINTVSEAKEQNGSEMNESIKIVTQHVECLNESDQLEDSILKLKKENNTFLSIKIDRDETNYSTEVENNNYSDSNIVEKCENVTFVEAGKFDDAKPETRCECGIPFIGDKKKILLHLKKCAPWKFYNLAQNKNNILKACGLCDYSTHDAKLLHQHFDGHYKRNELDCKLCDYTGQDFANMAFHRYTHMPTDKSKLHCLKCLVLFRTPKGLQFHFRSTHLGKDKGGLCDCGTSFTTVKKWRNHEKTRHRGVNENSIVFVCDCCGLRFRFRSQIVTHLRTRAGLNKVVCDKCGTVFNRKRNLKSHIKNKYSNIERVKCPKCPKTFAHSSFQKHIEMVHGDKNFSCELCSAAYTSLKSLKYHMLGHTKERPYKCSLCNASYKNKTVLTVHIRKHTQEKPFICSVCYKGFPTTNQLKVHNSVHTNVRRYQCKDCDRSFHAKKLLLEHCVKIHPGTVLPGL